MEEICILTPDHFRQAFDLELLASEMAGEDYHPCPEKRFEAAIAQGLSMGYFVDRELAAIRIVEQIKEFPDDEGDCLNLSLEERGHIGFFVGIFVLPAYRRRGIATAMTLAALKKLRAQGAKHVYVTVSPTNRASLGNLAQFGFVVQETRRMYGDKQRHVLYLALRADF